jgi:hypothetical protein
MPLKKTVLFVTYGGGHARMVIPVLHELSKCPEIRTETLACTSAGPILRAEGLPYCGYKDFIRPDDRDAQDWGKTLAARYHSPESGMELAESVAYLGLSYHDLLLRHGESEAAELFKCRQRHAFFQIGVLGRVIERIAPDMVVTTNAPRSEQAAIAAANERGIPTMSMVDLFGLSHPLPLDAEYVTVLSEEVAINIRKSQTVATHQRFLVTGNPAFDCAIGYRHMTGYAWRRRYLSQVPASAKALLWIDQPDQPASVDYSWRLRSEMDVVRDLERLANATKQAGGYLLIRPHPSQPRSLYDAWIRRSGHPHVVFAGALPLYPLLNASDVVATYASTVGCEAILMRRPVLQLNFECGRTALPLAELGLAHEVRHPDDLPKAVRDAFAGDVDVGRVLMRSAEIFPQERAAPKIAGHIRRIVAMQESGM